MNDYLMLGIFQHQVCDLCRATGRTELREATQSLLERLLVGSFDIRSILNLSWEDLFSSIPLCNSLINIPPHLHINEDGLHILCMYYVIRLYEYRAHLISPYGLFNCCVI
jgi:hypothetical protein